MKTTKSILAAVRQINSCHDAYVNYNPSTKDIEVCEVVSVNSTINSPLEGFYQVFRYQSRFHGKMTQKQLHDILINFKF